jgi:hypothetical protein
MPRRTALKLFALTTFTGILAACGIDVSKPSPGPSTVSPESTRPSEQELTPEQYLDKLDRCLKNIHALNPQSPQIFSPDDVKQVLVPEAAANDPVTRACFFTPELDLLILEALKSEADAQLQAGKVDTKTLIDRGLEAATKSIGADTIKLYLAPRKHDFNLQAILLRWESSTPLPFTETKPTGDLSGFFLQVSEQVQDQYPVPVNITSHITDSHYTAEEISISQSQTYEISQYAKDYLTSKGISFSPEEIDQKTAEAVLLHELSHALDILTNPSLLKYLPKDTRLADLYRLRAQVGSPAQISGQVNDLVKYDVRDSFTARSIFRTLVDEPGDPGDYMVGTRVYGAEVIAAATGKFKTNLDPILLLLSQNPTLSKDILAAIGNTTFTQTELLDGTWKNKLPPDKRETLGVKLIEDALSDPELKADVATEIDTLVSVYSLDTAVGNARNPAEMLPKLAGWAIDRHPTPDALSARDIEWLVADKIVHRIFSGKAPVDIPPEQLRDLYWNPGIRCSSETLAEVAGATLYYRSHPVEGSSALRAALDADPAGKYIRKVIDLLGPNAASVIKEVVASLPDTLVKGVARNPVLNQQV